MRQAIERILWAALLVTLYMAAIDGGIVSQQATAAVYIHEKSDTAVPSGVLTALDKLNRQGIVATVFDADTTDGSGETPDQYKAALEAAKQAGLPALVVMAGSAVEHVVKAPSSEQAVLEAVE